MYDFDEIAFQFGYKNEKDLITAMSKNLSAADIGRVLGKLIDGISVVSPSCVLMKMNEYKIKKRSPGGPNYNPTNRKFSKYYEKIIALKNLEKMQCGEILKATGLTYAQFRHTYKNKPFKYRRSINGK